ncbi:YraN family protein [Ferrovum sp.]|uniref:YraN family protein n=1 Tax=Ferrovum sp. TaxID=2609467 RepID=UPI0026105F50|nr:YraN family protein [Ferrovum sp.]
MNQKGSTAEEWATQFLHHQGLTLIARNYQCRFGEIDAIARDGTTLIFIEVRWRNRTSSLLIESIDARKQRCWWLTAQHYLACHGLPAHCRFDVLLLEGSPCHLRHWLQNVDLGAFSRGSC